MTEDTDLDRLFTHLSDEGRRRPVPDAHPVPEKLSAYLANELSPEEDDALQEHLTGCTLCADLLLDLQRFLDPPEEDRPREGVADFETAAEWRELRGRMREKLGERVKGASESRRSRWVASLKMVYPLAAVLAVAVVGLGVYVLKLQDDLKAPRAGYHILLASATQTRGSVESELRLHEAPNDLSLTLIKPLGTDFPEYEAEISREKGAQVHTVKGLHYQKEEGITLLLSKDDFEPGMYKIVLRGLSAGQPKIAGEYWLSVSL